MNHFYLLVSININKMEYKLTPDDLEVGQEYSIQIYNYHYNKTIKDETYKYSYKSTLPGFEYIWVCEFINDEGTILNLFYKLQGWNGKMKLRKFT